MICSKMSCYSVVSFPFNEEKAKTEKREWESGKREIDLSYTQCETVKANGLNNKLTTRLKNRLLNIIHLQAGASRAHPMCMYLYARTRNKNE